MHLLVGTNQYYAKQISEVTKCSLTKKSELPFRFTNGGCSNLDDREVLLCFSYDSPKEIFQIPSKHNYIEIRKTDL